MTKKLLQNLIHACFFFYFSDQKRRYLPIKTRFEKNRIYQETGIITIMFNKEELYKKVLKTLTYILLSINNLKC